MNIKKIALISVLGGSMALLSACGDDNPLLDPFYTNLYSNDFQGAFAGKEKNLCPFYFSDPSAYEKQKMMCEEWLPGFAERSMEEIAQYNKNAGKPALKLTIENYQDPDFWKAVSENMPVPTTGE